MVALPVFLLALPSLHSAQIHLLLSTALLVSTDLASQVRKISTSYPCCWDSFHQLQNLRRKKASAQKMTSLILQQCTSSLTYISLR